MLIGQKYIYVGQNNQEFTNGESYRVIMSGLHWEKDYGFVVWMTTDNFPDTTDCDYGCSMSLPYFTQNFWR